MFGQLTYIIWLAVFVGVPIVLLMHWRRAFWRRKRALGWVLLGALVGGWAWDAASVQLRVWFYAPEHITSVWLLGLPLEEWLWIGGTTLLFALTTIVLIERERS
jgi:lycopene cyclase domain-containing protein